MNNMTRPALSGYKSNHSYSPCDARRFHCSLSRLGFSELDGSEVAGAILLPAWVVHISDFSACHWEVRGLRTLICDNATSCNVSRAT